MNSIVTLYSIAAVVLFLAVLRLLFHEKSRTAVKTRSEWMTTHPRGYTIIVAFCALVVLAVAYVIALRHV